MICSRRTLSPVVTSLVGALLGLATLTMGCTDPDGTHTPAEDVGLEEDVTEDVEETDVSGEPDVQDAEQEDVPPPGPARIDISPETITFSGIETGESDSATVTIRNLGESPLVLSDAQLSQFGHSGSGVFSAGDNWPDFPVELEHNTFRDLDVVYTPTEPGSHRGEIVLFSTDPDDGRISLRIETISAYPEIEAPQRVNFGTVPPGESHTEPIEIFNRGLTPLLVEAIQIDHQREGSQVFSTEIRGAAGANELPLYLDRNHFLYIDVTFTPDDEETERAELLLESTDPADSPLSVALSANRPEPCLQTSGDIDFETVSPGNSSTKSLTLLNCSLSQPLEITELELVDDGGGIFEFADAVDDELTINPTQTAEIRIRATMSGEQEVVGLISFSSNDPSAAETEHQLRARPFSSGQ